MTLLKNEIHRIIKETLRERGVTSIDQEFILNLFDSVLATLGLNRSLTESDKVSIREKITSDLLSNDHLLLMLRQQTAELGALRRLSLHLSSSLDLSTILRTVVSDTMDLFDHSRTAHIFLYDAEEDILEFGAALDDSGLERNKAFAEPRRTGITYKVARSAERIIVEDMSTDNLYKGTPADWRGSILGMPLKFEGTVVGVMSVSRAITGDFSEVDLRFLDILAEQAAVAISNARIHAQVSKEANSDRLTGLPNRRALDEHIEEELLSAYRTGHSFATVMMDLDGFKDVNDKYGHAVGDNVLKVLFNYLSQGLRSSDFLARYGGDELTLVLHKSDMASAKLVTEKMLEKLERFHYTLSDGSQLDIGMSGGIALYPIHGQTASQLLRAADAALYRSKKSQRGSFIFASPPTGLIS